MKRVFVGSKSEVKIEATRQAFAAVWPNGEWDVTGHYVSSGVHEQPRDEEETIRGARNRASRMRDRWTADYFVGIEGGLSHAPGFWTECGWVVVQDQNGVEGIAATARIIIPPRLYRALVDGTFGDLNAACKGLFGVANAGAGVGYFGLMTNDAVKRTGAYADAVSFALARFVRPMLFL